MSLDVEQVKGHILVLSGPAIKNETKVTTLREMGKKIGSPAQDKTRRSTVRDD